MERAVAGANNFFGLRDLFPCDLRAVTVDMATVDTPLTTHPEQTSLESSMAVRKEPYDHAYASIMLSGQVELPFSASSRLS